MNFIEAEVSQLVSLNYQLQFIQFVIFEIVESFEDEERKKKSKKSEPLNRTWWQRWDGTKELRRAAEPRHNRSQKP